MLLRWCSCCDTQHRVVVAVAQWHSAVVARCSGVVIVQMLSVVEILIVQLL